MLDIELCRICLADSVRMYPIEHTRYHEVFEWYTEDTMDMNNELPYSVCYLCNAVLNRLHDFLKNMIHTEIYLKEILRNTSKLTYESVEKLKKEMTSKPYNLSKVWLRNSNYIALDAYKGHRPPRELRRYFDHPPIMIEYHKPYEHMKLEDIPEEQEPEEVNEEESEEAKEAEIKDKIEVESEQIKETETDKMSEAESETIKEAGSKKINEAETEDPKHAETEEINEAESKEKMEVETDQLKESKSGQIKDKKLLEQNSNLPEQESKSPHQNKDQSKSPQECENQGEFANDDDEIISITEDMRLVWSSDSENESQNIPDIEKDDELIIEFNNSSQQSNHNSKSKYANKRTKTPDPIDSFLLCAKKYRPPEKLAESFNVYVTEEAQTPYLELIKIATEGKTQEKEVKKPEPVKFHNPYLQFIEERVSTEEKQHEKRIKAPKPVKYHHPCLQEQCIATREKSLYKRLKTSDPEKCHSQNLQLIEHISVKATEPGQTSKQMEIDKNILYTNTPPVNDQQSLTELAAKKLKESYFNLYRETVKETPFNVSNEPLVIEKLTPVSRGPQKPVSKIHELIKANEPAKIIVTSEPKKYIHSYVDFVKGIVNDSVEKTSISENETEKYQEIVPIPPKIITKSKPKKISRPKAYDSVEKTSISEHEKETYQEIVPIPPKITTKSKPKKISRPKVYDSVEKTSISEHEKETYQEIVPIPPKITTKSKPKKISRPKLGPKTPVLEKPSKNKSNDGKISGYCYFDHQKTFRRASILRKTHHPNRNKRAIKELANKIKNRAAVLRKELIKTDLNAKNVLEENAVAKPAPYDEDQAHGRSKLQEENSSEHLQLNSKEHSDKLLTEIPLKLSQDIKNTKLWQVVECTVKSKYTDRVSDEQKLPTEIPLKFSEHIINKKLWHVVEYPVKSKYTDRVSDEHKDQNKKGDQYNDQVTLKDQEHKKDQMWSDEEDNTMDSQVDQALKVLDESLKDEDSSPILVNEDFQEHIMPNDHMTDKNDSPLQIIDGCIIIEDDLEDNNKPNDQDDLSLVVQDVFTLKDHGLEDEHPVPKEQYDQIIMLANQDDQVMEDGNVAVKIESVDEDFQGSFEVNHENENILYENETFSTEDIMDPNNDSNGTTEHGDFKIEENIQIDDKVIEYEPHLQEKVTKNENTDSIFIFSQRDRDGPSNNKNPKFESDYNEIPDFNEQEHYAIRNISQTNLMPTVQLERLPIQLIKKTSSDNKCTGDEIDKYSCTHCDFKTTVRLLMFRHQNVHDINKRFVCNVCQHRFLSHYHLSRHKVIHDDRTKFYCAYCNFQTTVKFSMETHQNKHRKSNRYPCQWCQRRFRSPSHRSRHSCTKKNLCKCVICNSEFKNESSYLCHMKEHTGVVPKSYICNICNKSFDSKKKYFNHKKQHVRGGTDKIKYTCKWCNKIFNQKSNCNKHMKLHEKYSEKVSLETENKQKMYDTDDEMELHENEKQDDKFVCGLCSQSFDTEIDLGRHAVDHIL